MVSEHPTPPAPLGARAQVAASSGTRTWLRLAVFFGAVALAALFVVADLDQLAEVIVAADPFWLLGSLLSGAASYAVMARSYQGIARAAGTQVPFWEMFKITLVANTVNYLVSTGGLSGFAVRMYYLTRRNVSSGTAVIISLAQTFMTNVTLLMFVLLGFVYLLASQSLHGTALVVTTVFLILFVLAALLAAFLLLHAELRRRTLFVLSRTAHSVLHQTIVWSRRPREGGGLLSRGLSGLARRLMPHRAPARTHIWRSQHNLNRGIEFLLSRRRQMISPAVYIIGDWLFTLLILQCAFLAVHHPIPPSFVIVGFAVGIVLSFVSLVPGGLGVMEGSMAAIYVSLGVPLESAVVAVLIFRLAYYVLPVVASLFFFHGMFEQGRQVGEEVRSGELTPLPLVPSSDAKREP